MKISNRSILEIRGALIALDGQSLPVGGENAKSGVYMKPYDFTGSVRFRIGRMLSIIKPIAADVDKACDAIVTKYAVDNLIPPEYVRKYHAERSDLLDIETDVEITKLTEADLKLDVNPIPVSVLSVLNSIIE